MLDIKKFASNCVNKVIFEGKKNSPAILIVSGIVLSGVAIYTTYKKAPEGHKIIKDCKSAVTEVKKSDYISDKEKQQIIVKTYGKTALALGKTFAVPAAAEVMSVGCILTGSNIIQKRYLGMAAAYSATCADFEEYRERVANKYGKDAEEAISLGTDTFEVTEDKGDGKTKTQKVTIANGTDKLFIKYFKKDNPIWDDDETMLKMTFSALQNSIEDYRIAKGFITYNQILDMFYFDQDCCDGLVLGATSESGPVDIKYTRVKITDDNGVLQPAFAIEFKNLVNIYNEK